MLVKFIFISFLTLVHIQDALGFPECNSNPYVYFSTKTSYFAVRGADDIHIPKGCSVERFWLLARHGTRNPGDEDIIQISKNGPRLRDIILSENAQSKGHVCNLDIIAFKDWKFDLKPEDESKLTKSGFEEQEQLARKFQGEFSEILNVPYNRKLFKFRHTNKERTLKSAEGFAKGLFPKIKNVSMERPLDNDPILEFEDFCPKWKETVDDSPNKYKERKEFFQGDEMKSVLLNVQTVVGSEKWTMDDVMTAYDICRFSKAWTPDETSPWCALFTIEDLKVLEYYEDLKYWYGNGYWKSVTSEMACPLMKDVIHTFEYDGDLKAKFNFAHRQTVLPFLGLLGLYKDPYPLNHSNYNEAGKRLYRSSLIGSFSANVAFALLDCPASDESDQRVKKVIAMHQGKPIKIPKCSSEICHYKEFKNKFKNAIECDYETICSFAQESSCISKILLIFMIICTYIAI